VENEDPLAMNVELENPVKPASLQIFSLGGLKILHHGKAIPGLTSKPAQALLVYLAYQGQTVSRSALAELLWEDRPLERALANLRVTLLRLKRLIPEVLEIGRTGVQLAVKEGMCWFDIHEFQKRRGEGDYSGALELVRGEFLHGFSLSGSRAFEDWQFSERECLLNEGMYACQQLVNQFEASGEIEKAIFYCNRLFELDARYEPGHRQIMRLLAQNGQQAAAIQHFQSFRRLLEKELGIQPDPLTFEVYRQVQEGRLESGSPGRSEGSTAVIPTGPAHHLPLPASLLVGRQEELVYILSRMNDPNCRLLTILGPGGIGKTRLALEAAHQLMGSFKDGVFFVSLAGITSPEQILQAIAQAMDFQAGSSGDPDQQVLAFLQRKTLLVVLDNFEQLLQPKAGNSSDQVKSSGSQVVLEILQNVTDLKILVTSRIRLNLLEEWRLPLSGLAFENPSISLFVQAARRRAPGFSLAGQKTAVQKICEIVDGTPLAIELAAAWVPLFSCTQIVDQIHKNLDFLAADLHNLPDRQRSIRALFEYSWGLLNFEERTALSRLSVFPEDGELEQILAVSGADRGILRSLVEKSLVQVRQDGRYALHQLVRQYAFERLQIAGEADETQKRFFQAFLDLAGMAEQALHGRKQEIWWMRLELERVNFDRALERGFHRQADVSLPAGMVIRLGWFWRIRSHVHEAHRWQDEALNLPGLGLQQRAILLRLAGSTDWLQGNFARALVRLKESLAIWQSINPSTSSERAYSLHFLGMTRYQMGEKETACQLFQESAQDFKFVGDEWGYAFSSGWLGKVAGDLGEPGLAVSATQECLAIMRWLGDRWGLALFLSNEAWRLFRAGELEEARRSAEELLSLRINLGHIHSLAEAFSLLGEIERAEGHLEKAKEHFFQALKLYESLGNQRYVNELMAILSESGSFAADH
jgi:predicted ATPase/DNA-binding SARP family transcriptional activator